MSKQDNGGAAFPLTGTDYNAYRETYEVMCIDPGMSLRDYFAAKAMQGRVNAIGKIPDGAQWNVDLLAEQAYAVADAMLKARQS